MLKYAEENDIKDILSFVDDGAFGTKIKSIIEVYGVDGKLVDAWYDKCKTVVVRFDGAITLYCTQDTEYEEVRQLVFAIGGSAVFGEYNGIINIFGKADRFGSVVQLMSEVGDFCVKDASERLHEIYNLISQNIPDSFSEDGYMYWLSDFMYRYNRGRARAVCVTQNDKAVACSVTSAQTGCSAIISGVACRKEYRGSGFGKAAVLGLAGQLQRENKSIFLFVLNENALSFYKKTGFTEIGKWAEIQL